MEAGFYSSFSALADQYDAFILDLWGVIHDGQELYPGAKDCLKRLRGEGKKIVLLSNAPRRASNVAAVLRKMGVTEEDYDALITSGETAYKYLSDKGAPFFRAKGGSYIYLGLEKDRCILAGLPYSETTDAKAAHFLLLSHSSYDNQPKSEIEPLFERCLAANLPALCINPDMEVVRQSGEHVYCAGALAADYEKAGGKVTYFGKPHPLVYEASFLALGDLPRSRILCVGDNLATDIVGARKNELKSALITCGVLKREIGGPQDKDYRVKLGALIDHSGAAPDYVLAAFNW